MKATKIPMILLLYKGGLSLSLLLVETINCSVLGEGHLGEMLFVVGVLLFPATDKAFFECPVEP